MLQQAVAPPLTGGAFCGGSEARFKMLTTAPVLVMAQVFTEASPQAPTTSPLVQVEPAGVTTIRLPLEIGDRSLTQFQLLFSDVGNNSSSGAHVWLDDVEIVGPRIPIPFPPV